MQVLPEGREGEGIVKRIIAFFVSLVLTVSCIAGCSAPKQAEGKAKIIAAIYPIYDWLSHLTEGSETTGLSLLADNGTDIHSYQLTADDMMQIQDCDLFVYIGGESDNWAKDVVESMKKNGSRAKAVSLMELMGDKAKEEEHIEGMQEENEEEEEKTPDEHIWLSLKNARYLCSELTKTLSESYPDDKALYETNAEKYDKALAAMDGLYAKTLSEKKRDTLLFGDRFPFRYLTDDYNLKYYAAFAGCSAETEASFETVAFLASKLDELQLPAVITIDNSDRKIAQTIINTSKSNSAQILTLNSMQSMTADKAKTEGDYLRIMEKNLEVLQQALN